MNLGPDHQTTEVATVYVGFSVGSKCHCKHCWSCDCVSLTINQFHSSPCYNLLFVATLSNIYLVVYLAVQFLRTLMSILATGQTYGQNDPFRHNKHKALLTPSPLFTHGESLCMSLFCSSGDLIPHLEGHETGCYIFLSGLADDSL